MKCKDCDACYKGYFKSKPDDYVCTGVYEPFVIENIDNECTEHLEKNKEDTPMMIEKSLAQILKNQYLILHYLSHCTCYDSGLNKNINNYTHIQINNTELLKCKLLHQSLVRKHK